MNNCIYNSGVNPLILNASPTTHSELTFLTLKTASMTRVKR
ncbi:hypothetical protein LDVICp222 [lymphocystis disease virus-China]|uniref:Uncharacterized protein n=1 Tax=lymphocystis disease virus-China TaxID=256729 RepID=Q677P2_9VIRU|nr:hypothetical protein LDVICp222 [lymphocystis disease virus-China]AAU11065.1 hypothetical protein [lymphocystis disease virus-China]